MRTLNLLLLTLIAVALFANSARGATTEIHGLEDIRARVERYLVEGRGGDADDIRVVVGRLDARLRLPRCASEPAAFLPQARGSSGNVTVGVRCSAPKKWTIYVPARVEIFKPVAVLERSLRRGVPLAEADVRFERRDVSRLGGGYFTRASDVVGLQTRRTLTEGTTLSVNMLTQPTWVRRGERVTLVAGGGSIQVRTEGKALTDAARGQRVSVRNVRSRRVVEGVVISPGVVRVRL